MNSLHKQLVRSLVICFSFTVCVSSASAQVDQWGAWDNGVTEAWQLSSRTFTSEEARSAIERWKRIGPTPQNHLSWEGDYFTGGETHGTYIRWSPDEGFVIADVDKCQALVMGVSYGSVEVTPSLIKFFPEFSKSSKSHGHAHAESKPSAEIVFVPVRWQDQLLLIQLERLSQFSDYVAGLGDFNGLLGFDGPDLSGSYFYAKYAGEKVSFGDTPILPPEYQPRLKKPIVAKITAVAGRRLKRNYSYEFNSRMFSFAAAYDVASLTFVRVNVGGRHGVKEGLFLRVSLPDLGEAVRLTEVRPDFSTGVIVREVQYGKETVYSGGRERLYPRVAPGWSLTTAPR